MLDLGESWDNVHQKVFVWQTKCKDFDPIVLEKHRAMAVTTIVDLKKRVWDFEFQTFSIDNQCEKIQEGKKNMTS